MYLDEINLKYWCTQKDDLFKKNQELSQRFEKIKEIFNWIQEGNQKVSIENNEVKIGNGPIKIGDRNPCIEMFGPAIDSLTAGSSFTGVYVQADCFDSSMRNKIIEILSIFGGFDFKNPGVMRDEYRIVSSAITGVETTNYSSYSYSKAPSSHFADNTYFFEIMRFIQGINETPLENFNIAMRYPGKYMKEVNDDNKFSKEALTQKDALKLRFPYKFLWMWANKDKVLHPFSLMAFRNFLSSKFMEDILNAQNPKLTPANLANMNFGEFKEIWAKISEAVIKKLGFDRAEEQSCDLETVSKLISVLMVEESDMKNSSDLLKTSKQIILYGAPGTGKTYTAMKIAKEFMACTEVEKIVLQEDEFENKHRFSKKCLTLTEKSNENAYQKIENGLYEIIQFHPNYTYQDFIGGISPKLDNGALSYELTKGVFQRFCKTAKVNPECNFVLIIDEINRANLSEVFGELLYALEYRDKAVNIPYFGEFVIPSNVYIIGTMNDVDKSLVTFDLALRRRFGFFRLDPELDSLNDMFAIDEDTCLIEENALSKYIDKCKQLNISLIAQKGLALDSSYQIGQAYFKKIENFLTEQIANQLISPFELEKLWIYHIEPLLQEYLGMSLESGEIKRKLEDIKKEFIKENK